MDTVTLKKINSLLASFAHIKPYRAARLPLKSCEEFMKLPLMMRDDIRQFPPQGEVFSVTATSGSSGKQMHILHSKNCFQTHLRRLIKIYKSCGMESGDLCLNLCSYELNSGGRIMEQAFRALGAGVIPLGSLTSPEKIKEAIALIKSLKPAFINSYTNQLYDIFSVLKRKHSVKSCILNGEPLYPWFKDSLKALSGTRIFDHYGAMEFSGFAIAENPKDTSMKLFEDGLYLEILGKDGRTAELGEGRIVVTDLENTCMPFIRYVLGDRVRITRKGNAKYIRVLGRDADSLLIEGKITSRRLMAETILRLLGHPRFFCIIDKNKQDFKDNITLHIPEKDLSASATLIKELGGRLHIAHLVTIRPHSGHVPKTSTGKYHHIIDLRGHVTRH